MLIFVVVRVASGPRSSDGIVSIGPNLGTSELHHQAFRVERPQLLAVHATGSFETDTTLAAYGWIVDRAAGTVYWRMDPALLSRGRGTLASVDDTLQFEPGVYDAYFTTYGDPLVRPETEDGGFFDRIGNLLSNDGRAWHADAARWRFAVAAADPLSELHVEHLHGDEGRPEINLVPVFGEIWSSGPVRNREEIEYEFEVAERVSLRLLVTGEHLDNDWMDHARLVRFTDGELIWSSGDSSPVWAGGSLKNQSVDTTLVLDTGLYRVSYRTDQSHAYNQWTANPPWIPVSWGARLIAADSLSAQNVSSFDPWQSLPQISSFTCVGEDEYREDAFSLADTTHVLLYSLGEVVGSTSYDYGALIRVFEDRAGVEEVWAMTSENSSHAGGASKNRVAETILTLAPGSYKLTYETDGSHSCDDFNSTPPEYPQRWGATLFALDRNFDLSTVERIDPRELNRERLESLRNSGRTILADLTPIGNDEERQATFVLDESTTVRIYAIGELTVSSSYDYAWLEDGNGSTIWTMTRENTAPAGGDGKNRVFDGELTLQPGAYTVFYESDGSHAYGDFRNSTPYDPRGWGVQVSREDSE